MYHARDGDAGASRIRFFFFQAEDGIRDKLVTGVQTCALPISVRFAPVALADTNIACVIWARSSIAERSSASRRFAPRRSDSDRYAPSRFARHSFALVRNAR